MDLLRLRGVTVRFSQFGPNPGAEKNGFGHLLQQLIDKPLCQAKTSGRGIALQCPYGKPVLPSWINCLDQSF
jgi:hypothetical protein